MRFRPRMAFSRFEGGRDALENFRQDWRADFKIRSPIVCVENLELGKVPIKGRNISTSDANECADF